MSYQFPKVLSCMAMIVALMVTSTSLAKSPFRIHKGQGISTVTSVVVNGNIVTQTGTTVGTGTHFGKYVLNGTFQLDTTTGMGTGSFEQKAADGSIARGIVKFQVFPNGEGLGMYQFMSGTKRFRNVKGQGPYRTIPIDAERAKLIWWNGKMSY